MNTNVVIVGGGIAGLTTALALSQYDISSLVLEQSNFEDKSGAGIQLTPNATRVLFQLGLENSLTSAAHEPNILNSRHWRTGRVLCEVPLRKIISKYCTFPYLQMHRSNLIKILQQECEQQASVELISEVEVTEIDQGEDKVNVSSSRGQFSAPLVVGADGVHSKMSKLIGNQEQPKFSGWHAWRTTLYDPKPTHPSLENMNIWCGRMGHIVHYPVDSKRTLNCIFVTKSTETFSGQWKQRGSVKELGDYFCDWHNEVTEILDHINQDSLLRWGLYHHARMKNSWSRHRVVLLGDAIHATMPYLAQGAALAIEDAMALSNHLKTHYPNVAKVIKLFVESRKQRVERIQTRSERIGQIYHAAPPWSFVRDVSTKCAIHQLVKEIYSFETI